VKVIRDGSKKRLVMKTWVMDVEMVVSVDVGVGVGVEMDCG